ncbi:hypothetical protein [Lichenicola cladoniae]|uniref:hypothetical protein n=1 Tax=Lichenicola cladoniae TaxID=1484109 RepID=UPI00149534EB|nr:hypothetical protein [Lichenicola cladoniae]
MVHDQVADHHPAQQPAEQVGLLEPLDVAATDLVETAGQKLRRERHEAVDVARVVGVELALDDQLGRDHRAEAPGRVLP